MAGPAAIIAATFGWDVSEARERRYQDTRTKQPIYATGNEYYTVSKKTPKDTEYAWRKAKDQFFAEQSGTILWVADANEESE